MDKNKSLSARIRRRNAQGFRGEGNNHFIKKDSYGDYTDENQNGKLKDHIEANNRRSILRFNPWTKNRAYCKKYADNHQKVN